ncbi:sugar transferase [Atopococcus tabaci]|uniref:sugar transferase n=1 Tax=Atopococcus tabaci TaxID=269774 RepID=UPI00042A538C|nr:sugar transferase [Atopococcus tabaci]
MKTKEGFDKTKKILIGIVEIFIYHISILLSFYMRYGQEIPSFNYVAYENAFIYIITAFVVLNVLFGVYVLYNKSIMDILILTVIIQVVLSIMIMAMTFFGRWFTFPRSIIAISFVVSSFALFLWRIAVFKLYERIAGTKRVMVVGKEENLAESIYNFENAKNKRHKVTCAVTGNYYTHIKNNLSDVDIVYLTSDMDYAERIKIYELIVRNNKKIFVDTSFEHLLMVNPNIMNIEDESVIELSNFRISPEFDVIKRSIDIIVSLAMIVLTSPLMLIAAVLVKATSAGPVIYKQVRVTKDQKEFNIYKFRTMSATAEKESGPVLASANDMRVTFVGKYLRSLRIDELPQLFNVLNGTMSLVGPRPERPFFVEQFKKENPYYDLRHNVRAGITGYAQVYGKYTTNFNRKLNFDLVYIKKYSLLLDVKILLQTIKVLFDKVSSQGVEEEELLNKKMPEHIKVYD